MSKSVAFLFNYRAAFNTMGGEKQWLANWDEFNTLEIRVSNYIVNERKIMSW